MNVGTVRCLTRKVTTMADKMSDKQPPESILIRKDMIHKYRTAPYGTTIRYDLHRSEDKLQAEIERLEAECIEWNNVHKREQDTVAELRQEIERLNISKRGASDDI